VNKTNIEEVERLFATAPFITDLGLKLVSVAPGEVHSSLVIAERHLQQDGFVHAGVQGAIADHTAGAAAASLVEAGHAILGAEFKINLLRAARGVELRCIAKVLKPGRRLIVAESEIYCRDDAGEKLVSKATVTLAVVEKP
jgi:uncharacterized protein (TIGR00369 family)